MKKLKKLLLCFSFCFVIIFSCGCADIEYSRVAYENGVILDAVSVKLDTTKITNAGFNVTKVTNDVKIKMNQYLNAIINSFYNRDDGLLDIEKIAVCNNLTTKVVAQNSYIIASIEFRNYNTFKYFYGLHLTEDSENDNENTIKTFLFNKNLSTGKTIFAGQDAEFITNDFVTYFNGNFNIENCNLSYVFGTPESKIHSDANFTFTQDGVNYHQWILNSKDDTITTFTYQMKPINWYLLGLALTLVLILVLFIISLFKKNQPKEKTQIISEENNNIENN